MPILTPSDFVGRFAVSLPYEDGEQRLLDCIERYENSYLNKLFGVDLFASFDGTIPDQYNDAFFIDYKCKQYESKGIKDMLLGFIWFHFCFDSPTSNTSIGNSLPNIEAGTLADSATASPIFNQSVDTFKAIQYKCILNNEDLFNGQYLRYKSWF